MVEVENLTILHISDLHTSGPIDTNISLLLNYIKNKNIDVCIITDDLVNSGQHKLEEAYKQLKEALEKNGIKTTCLCCGKRVVDQSKIRPMFSSYLLNTMINPQNMNEMCLDVDEDVCRTCVERLDEYCQLEKKYYNDSITSDRYSVHTMNFGGKKIAVVSLNMIWTVNNNKKHEKLLYSEPLLKAIAKKIRKFDFKIALMHIDLKISSTDSQASLFEALNKKLDNLYPDYIHEIKDDEALYSTKSIFTTIESLMKFDTSSKDMGFKILDFDFINRSVSTETCLINNNELLTSFKQDDIPESLMKECHLGMVQVTERNSKH